MLGRGRGVRAGHRVAVDRSGRQLRAASRRASRATTRRASRPPRPRPARRATLTVRDPEPVDARSPRQRRLLAPAGAAGQGRERDRRPEAAAFAPITDSPLAHLSWTGADRQRARHDQPRAVDRRDRRPARRRLRQGPRVHAGEREPMKARDRRAPRRWPRCLGARRYGLRAAGGGRPGARIRARRAARSRAGRARPHRDRDGTRAAPGC